MKWGNVLKVLQGTDTKKQGKEGSEGGNERTTPQTVNSFKWITCEVHDYRLRRWLTLNACPISHCPSLASYASQPAPLCQRRAQWTLGRFWPRSGVTPDKSGPGVSARSSRYLGRGEETMMMKRQQVRGCSSSHACLGTSYVCVGRGPPPGFKRCCLLGRSQRGPVFFYSGSCRAPEGRERRKERGNRG